MTHKDDERLNGRYPEFTRISNRPGIGADAMKDLAAQLKTEHGQQLLNETGDVPSQIKIGRKSMPLGRYLQRKLREEVEHYDPLTGELGPTPTHALHAHKAEVQAMYQDSQHFKEGASLQEFLIDKCKVKVKQIENRAKIYNKRSTL